MDSYNRSSPLRGFRFKKTKPKISDDESESPEKIVKPKSSQTKIGDIIKENFCHLEKYLK